MQKVEAEAEADKPAASSSSTSSDSSKSSLVLLLQFLHLFNLFHPNPTGPSTFAPSRTIPRALEMSTGQEVAAVAKVYDQLANGPLEGGGGDAFEILANIEKGSNDEVLPDVSFATLRSMIFKLTAPPSAAVDEADAKATGLDGPPKDFVPLDKPSPSTVPVSFIQASEILDKSKAEPEGGQPSTVPATGATETHKGQQGGSGIVLGDKAATSSKADGTAASAVEEPINTTTTTVKSEPKLNWAALAEEDDDDLGEAPVFEPLPSSTTSALVTPAPGTPAAVEPEPASASASASASAPAAAAAKPASNDATGGEAPLSPKPKKGKQSSGGANKGNNAGGRAGNANGKTAAPRTQAPKAQPKVDEDGFILQESKRTKYLQQKQQQQQQQQQGGRGGSGGGRGGGAGAKGSAGAGRGGRANGGAGRGQQKGGEGRPSNNSSSNGVNTAS